MARKYRYNPPEGLFVPGLKPGQTIEARDDEHAKQLDNSPAFKRVKKTTKKGSTPKAPKRQESESEA